MQAVNELMMRGVTLKECQSDFQHVRYPPLLVILWVPSVGGDILGGGLWREQ